MKGLFYVFLAVVISLAVYVAIQYVQSDPDCVKSPATGDCVSGYSG